MTLAPAPLNHDRELVFVRLYRIGIGEGDHLRGSFQFDDDIVRPLRGTLSSIRPDVSRERKAAVLVNVTQRFELRICGRLELNPTVRHRLAPLENYLAFD